MPHSIANTHRGRFPTFFLISSLLAALLLFGGCGKTIGGNSLHVKAGGFDKDLAIKSAYAFPVTKTFTDVNGKMTTASAYNVYLANYDLDAKNFGATLDKPLTGDDQVRVVFALIGNEGTNDKSPPNAATYSAKADKYVKAESAGLVMRKSGSEIKSWLDRSMLSGEVKLNSATADEIAGDVNLTSGETSIKGSFTAKVLKRK
ncbi:MAG TPA: hypothetical protein VE863_21440 [Pyrinomonadaceae bacterium]|jgi:hypothetical protein|nr:hypothetical protein [Pyrinomonadaceae bacterium]